MLDPGLAGAIRLLSSSIRITPAASGPSRLCDQDDRPAQEADPCTDEPRRKAPTHAGRLPRQLTTDYVRSRVPGEPAARRPHDRRHRGSKRLLTRTIVAWQPDLSPGSRVLEVFSGTSRVGQCAFLQAGRARTSRPTISATAYAGHTIAQCYIAARSRLRQWLAGGVPRRRCIERCRPQARMVHGELLAKKSSLLPSGTLGPGHRRHATGTTIDAGGPRPHASRAIALISPRRPLDRVDAATTGVQLAYLQVPGPRALTPPHPSAHPRPHRRRSAAATHSEAAEVRELPARRRPPYLDPVYNLNTATARTTTPG